MHYFTISDRIRFIRSNNCVPDRIIRLNEQDLTLIPHGNVYNMTINTSFRSLLWVFLPQNRLFSQSDEGNYLIEQHPIGRGVYHKHEFIEILYVIEGSFDQILFGRQLHFTQGEVIITDQNCEHADIMDNSESAVLFLQIKATDLDRLLRSFDGSDELLAFLFHSLKRQKNEQSFLWFRPGTSVKYKLKADESDSMTDGNDSITDGKDSMTDGSDSMTDGNDSVTDGNDSMTDGSDSMTDGNNSVTDGNDSMTDGRDSVTDGNNSRTDESGPEAGSDPEAGSADPELEEILEFLHREALSRKTGYEQICEGLLLRLLRHLCRNYTMQLHSDSREGKEQAVLYEIERYIRLHPSTVCARELENTFHYHRNYFNLLLRKYRDCTLKQYIQDVRLNYARQLLEQTDLPVRQIAREVGYENTSFFYQLFKEHFGCTPKELQKIN